MLGRAVLSWQTASVTDANGRDYTYSRGDKTEPFLTLDGQAKKWATPSACIANDGERPEVWQERADRLKEQHGNGNGAGTPLTVQAVRWATPRASENENRQTKHQPSVLDGKGMALAAQACSLQRQMANGVTLIPNSGPPAPSKIRLNPSFVEWLMGFPRGWTDSGPSATAWSLWSQRMRFALSQLDSR